jgi:hypothetical protein
MQDWDTYQRAALEYSRMRPRRLSGTLTLASETLTLTADQKAQTVPEGCLAVTFVDWGLQVTLLEALTDTTTTQGWANEDGQLLLSPAPTEDDDGITIMYLARHLPDEDTETFPTIPAEDLHYVDDLEQAILLEVEADEVAAGPTLYTIGQTQVSRVAALEYLAKRASSLRGRVRLALEDPFAVWS